MSGHQDILLLMSMVRNSGRYGIPFGGRLSFFPFIFLVFNFLKIVIIYYGLVICAWFGLYVGCSVI